VFDRRKRLLVFAVPAAAVGIGAGAVAFTVMAVKDQTYVPSEPYAPPGNANRNVAVIYYSRSGHSEAVAREIARSFDAPIARVDADYPRDFTGQRRAVSDANAQVLPAIRIEPLDIATASRVFLVSPTWMFRPATPLWSYVEQTDLTSKNVVLVMTGNSRFEQAEIDAFAKRVARRGGRLCSHVFLRRGRIFWQKSREQLIEEVRKEVTAFRK
jgi:flavodoxin